MNNLLKVRDYQNGDFAEINQLWKDTGMGGSLRGDDEETIHRTIKAGGKLFVLENLLSHEIIGTSWLTHDGRRIYFHHFVIKTVFQGNKYAHLLLKSSMEFAKATGMQIKLEVHRDNLKAIQLYKKWGFNYLGDYEVFIIRDYKSIPQAI